MKKITILLILTVLFAFSCGQTDTGNQTDKSSEEQNNSLEKNKQVATTYHDLKAENIDIILTEDFIGRAEDGYTWDRESHRAYLSNGRYKVDSIVRQFGEGEYVGTMFIRTMEYRGDTVAAPIMHVKRFADGKIAEIWEYYDFKEKEEEEGE